jgi:predicted site-specific integrase-resolvase
VSAKENLLGRRRAATTKRHGARTALYLRVSTADQKPDLQYDGLRGYAERASLDVVRDYCDVAVSGRREGRPQLNALMAAARNREIDCVPDTRMWRNASRPIGGLTSARLRSAYPRRRLNV